jgi:CBS domain containing-hemolysin-like protein
VNHWLLLGTAGALLGEAFFSGTEMTLLNVNPAQLFRKARKGDWRAQALLSYYKAPDYWLAVTVLGTNLCVVSGAFCAEAWASQGPHWLEPLTGALNVIAVLLIGEILPKYILRPVATGWALAVTPVLLFLKYPAAPLGLVLRFVTSTINKARRGAAVGHFWASREDLTHVLSDRLRHADSLRLMASGVLKKLHGPASDLMTPLALAPTLPFPSSPKVWRNCLRRGEGDVARIVDRSGKLLALARTRDVLAIPPAGPAPERWPQRPLTAQSHSPLSEVLEAMRRARTDWAVLLSGDRLVGHLLLEELPARLMEG